MHPAESSSSTYGLVVLLLLLPTPPRGDAVTVGYMPESDYMRRTCTSLIVCPHRRTRVRIAHQRAAHPTNFSYKFERHYIISLSVVN